MFDMRRESQGQRMLGSIKNYNKKEMMLVDVKIAGTSINALVDMGAIYLFISKEVADKLSFKVKKRISWLNDFNPNKFQWAM